MMPWDQEAWSLGLAEHLAPVKTLPLEGLGFIAQLWMVNPNLGKKIGNLAIVKCLGKKVPNLVAVEFLEKEIGDLVGLVVAAQNPHMLAHHIDTPTLPCSSIAVFNTGNLGPSS